jgi:hypothetical protein
MPRLQKESIELKALTDNSLDVANVNGLMNGFFMLSSCKQTFVKKTLGLYF